MAVVLGQIDASGPAAPIGHYRARDGSRAADLSLDIDRPHVIIIVGKRGYGKSHTLGVIAESVRPVPEIAPVIVDPMGEFTGMEGARVLQPTISPADLNPQDWCSLVGLEPTSGPGGVLWDVVSSEDSIETILAAIENHRGSQSHRLVAANHVKQAARWDVFDPRGLEGTSLADSTVTVLDLSALPDAAKNAVVAVTAARLYRARVASTMDRLPWLLIDEVHTFFDGIAAPALRRVLTRGRTPGISLVTATQRPSAIPAVGLSQSDILIAHRLTTRTDRDAVEGARPSYVDGTVKERLPTRRGDVLIVDDATESVHAARIRERRSPHAGGDPRISGGEKIAVSED